MRSGVKVLGVWDDHDYGMNSGGKVCSLVQSALIIDLSLLCRQASWDIGDREVWGEGHIKRAEAGEREKASVCSFSPLRRREVCSLISSYLASPIKIIKVEQLFTISICCPSCRHFMATEKLLI